MPGSRWQTRTTVGLLVGSVTLLVSLSLLLPSLAMLAWGVSHREPVGQLVTIVGIVQLMLSVSGLVVGWRFVHRARVSIRQKDGKSC